MKKNVEQYYSSNPSYTKYDEYPLKKLDSHKAIQDLLDKVHELESRHDLLVAYVMAAEPKRSKKLIERVERCESDFKFMDRNQHAINSNLNKVIERVGKLEKLSDHDYERLQDHTDVNSNRLQVLEFQVFSDQQGSLRSDVEKYDRQIHAINNYLEEGFREKINGEKSDGWNRVKDGLPINSDVYICVINKIVTPLIFNNKLFRLINKPNYISQNTVTHWRELPGLPDDCKE